MSASVQPLRTAVRQSARAHSRPFTTSPSYAKALPFFLNHQRQGTHDAHDSTGTLRMIMFGKPGAGKGTLSARLVKKYDILSLSTGDLLRQHIAEKTEVGRIAEGIVASGGLLPDDIMLKVVTTKLDHLHNKHWILDGFPRTLGQGKLLDTHLRNQNMPLSLIVNLNVPDEIILSRISDRWVHLPSGRVYNMSYNRPRIDGLDDETGEPLSKRPDDNPVRLYTVLRLLAQFYASTSPLLSYYASPSQHPSSKLVSLQGETSDDIWPMLERAVKSVAPGVREREEYRRRTSLSEAVLSREQETRARATRMTN
ncbi:ADK-domain-containing protein [Amylostereum chailletii]|nr:ADK-domain-containing protein [Amylostereum chailletii]